MIFIVGVATPSIFRHAPIPRNMVVPPDNTTLVYKFSRKSTSHLGDVSWIPLASLLVKLGWNSTRETETLGADSDGVFV